VVDLFAGGAGPRRIDGGDLQSPSPETAQDLRRSTGFSLQLIEAKEEFSRKLLASQEQERQRIAAALHDSLGQSLLIIKNRIALAQGDADQRDIVEEQLGELSHSATAAIEECREIAYNLRPFQIGRFGLSKTLYGIFMRINEVTDIQASADIDDIDHLLTDEEQIKHLSHHSRVREQHHQAFARRRGAARD
jgi:signal transduction histidine kinase